MPLVCNLRIVERGLKIANLDSLPQTEASMIEHLENNHHCPVYRNGETPDQAHERFVREHPEVLDCKTCARENAPWSRANWEQAHATAA
jgi:hypothetical protein